MASYMGYIPAPVRYDRLLKPAEKLLYCELTASAGTGGFCMQDLTHLGEVLGCAESTVEGYLGSLEKRNFISIAASKDGRKKITVKVI